MEDAEKQDQFDVTFERVCSVPSATNIVDKEQEQFGVAFDQPFSIKEKPKRKGRRRISVGQFGASAGGENRSELRKSTQPDYD